MRTAAFIALVAYAGCLDHVARPPVAASQPASQPSSRPASIPASQPSDGLFDDPKAPILQTTQAKWQAFAAVIETRNEQKNEEIAGLKERARIAEDGQREASDEYDQSQLDLKLASVIGPTAATVVAALITALIAKVWH